LPLPDLNEIIEFILKNVQDPKKIIELGIGFNVDVLLSLQEKLPETTIIAVDSSQEVVEAINTEFGIKAILDDITKPNYQIYYNADLLYSIRPPLELVSPMIKLAKKIKTPLIIRPLSSELPDETLLKKFKMFNTKYSVLLYLKN